jgi:hypothetical protein
MLQPSGRRNQSALWPGPVRRAVEQEATGTLPDGSLTKRRAAGGRTMDMRGSFSVGSSDLGKTQLEIWMREVRAHAASPIRHAR